MNPDTLQRAKSERLQDFTKNTHTHTLSSDTAHNCKMQK